MCNHHSCYRANCRHLKVRDVVQLYITKPRLNHGNAHLMMCTLNIIAYSCDTCLPLKVILLPTHFTAVCVMPKTPCDLPRRNSRLEMRH